MKHSKDAPCYCKSRLLYRDCCYSRDNAGIQQKVHVARSHYDECWVENARCNEEQGCYEWMASRIKPFEPRKILDIGCGDGRGLLALTTVFPPSDLRIISLDENPDCLQRATTTLRKNGLKVEMLRRYKTVVLGAHSHALGIWPGKLKEFNGISLIEGDVLIDDQELLAFLDSGSKFDALTVWLIGPHPLRFECKQLEGLQMDNSGDYRLWVYKAAYRLASGLLKAGGVLHIVDRGALPTTEEIRLDRLNGHKEIAAYFAPNLEVQELMEFKPYTESTAPKRVPMYATPGTNGRMADMTTLAMSSIIAIKR